MEVDPATPSFTAPIVAHGNVVHVTSPMVPPSDNGSSEWFHRSDSG